MKKNTYEVRKRAGDKGDTTFDLWETIEEMEDGVIKSREEHRRIKDAQPYQILNAIAANEARIHEYAKSIEGLEEQNELMDAAQRELRGELGRQAAIKAAAKQVGGKPTE